MVAIAHRQAETFLKSIDRKIRGILAYGADAGLVAERARIAAERLAAADDPPGEILRIEDLDLETDPGRLAVELMTVPMFGGRKIVRTSTSRRVNTALLKPLMESELQGYLVVEAGNLKKDDSLRILFEKSPTAAAIACYPDEGASLEQLVSEVLAATGLTISSDARQALLTRLGADRAMSRGEIEKLALYVGSGTVEVADVEAIVGDASDLAVERIVAATLAGRGPAALQELDRAMAAGESAQAIFSALQRQIHRLHRARAAVDSGRSVDEVVRMQRPPLPPHVQRELESQLRAWTLPRLTAAIERTAWYTARSRQTGAPDDLLAERLVLELATRAGQGQARRA